MEMMHYVCKDCEEGPCVKTHPFEVTNNSLCLKDISKGGVWFKKEPFLSPMERLQKEIDRHDKARRG